MKKSYKIVFHVSRDIPQNRQKEVVSNCSKTVFVVTKIWRIWTVWVITFHTHVFGKIIVAASVLLWNVKETKL